MKSHTGIPWGAHPARMVVFVSFLTLAVHATPARAAEALVAVAANFAEVVETLTPEFEQRTGHTLVATIGSTGKLYAQITQGAPFQVMLSADTETPARLETEGLAVAGSRFTYAVGRLTLWSADPDRIGDDPCAALADPSLRFIAIANPELAPYGAAAREALTSLGLWDTVQTRLVMGQNIGQTYAMVASGAAELGFVALSAVLSPRAGHPGSRWDVPQKLYAPIRQDAVLLNSGADSAAAQAFLDFLRSDAAREVIARYGYGEP